MKVTVAGKNVYVRWQYENVQVLLKNGEPFLDKKGKEVFTQKTSCILSANGETLTEESVVRYYKDPADKDTARKVSLDRMLHKAFPGPDNKETRKSFWDAYISRKPQPKPTATNETPVVQLNPRPTEVTLA